MWLRSVGDVLRDARTGCTPVVFGYHGTARHKALLVGLGVWVGFIFCLGFFFFLEEMQDLKKKLRRKKESCEQYSKVPSQLGFGNSVGNSCKLCGFFLHYTLFGV